MCTLPNEVPMEYFAGLDQAGRRLDEAQRPELSHGTVDYVAPREYMVSRRRTAARRTKFLFLMDISLGDVPRLLSSCVPVRIASYRPHRRFPRRRKVLSRHD